MFTVNMRPLNSFDIFRKDLVTGGWIHEAVIEADTPYHAILNFKKDFNPLIRSNESNANFKVCEVGTQKTKGIIYVCTHGVSRLIDFFDNFYVFYCNY